MDPQRKIREWMQAELAGLGHGAKGHLADHLGVRPDAITRMANLDPGKETRVIQAHEYMQMAEFFAKQRAASGVPSAQESRVVKVAAFVQAGFWTESWEWDDDLQYEVAVPRDKALDGVKLFAAETKGPSMNRRWPEGTVVVFTNAVDTGESPVPGKRYVVERQRGDGQREHTVKLLHVDSDSKLWLVPESSDPLYQVPIPVEDGDETVVTIIGRVVYAVTRE